MRFVYLDEAGIGKKATEPSVVIAGVIVHADSQWRRLHEHFNKLRIRFCSDEQNPKPIFHAKDIWQGNKDFDRNKWKFEKRLALLRELCLTTQEFQLPIVYGHANKESIEK